MSKSLLAGILFSLLISVRGLSQSSAPPGITTAIYHSPSKDKESWQRLYMWLSSTFIYTAKEGQVELDSCLFIASHSLGLSRLSILAEGIDDPDLLAQSQW